MNFNYVEESASEQGSEVDYGATMEFGNVGNEGVNEDHQGDVMVVKNSVNTNKTEITPTMNANSSPPRISLIFWLIWVIPIHTIQA